jgi:hypothetical protein
MKTKDQLFTEAQNWVNAIWTERSGFGGCIIWAFATMTVLRQAGYNPIIQAGDLQWPIVDPKDDDGIMNTHFGYMWTPHEPASQRALAAGLLPEIHAWIGLLDTQECVDFSTHDLKNQAQKMGFTWRTPEPPKYLWGKPPAGVLYRPHRDATFFAMSRVKMLVQEITGVNII